MRSHRLFAGLACALALSAAASPGHTDASPLPGPGLYGSFGLNTGISGHPAKSNGFVFGAEGSVPFLLPEVVWFGLYGDVLRDFGDSTTRFSVGPEVGLGCFGFDGGLLARTAASATRLGWQFRGMLTVGLVALYAQYGTVPHDPEEQGFTQFGLLFKIPVPLATYSRSYNRPSVGDYPPPPPPPPTAAPPVDVSPAPAESGRWAEPPP